MSIKKLFESADKSRNYLAETNEKNAFKDVESSKNVEQISIKQNTFVPNIDYRYPENFAKFGSAYYYYSGALGRLVDYYPYDGSDAEQNEFYNKSLDVEKFIFNNLYPRVNGYANFDSSSYIDFKGGPHGVTYKHTSDLFGNPADSKRHSANLYDKNIYQSAGLPDSYGTGSRESNLRANFDSGVTVEFWLKSDKLAESTGSATSQVIFDMWNNNASGSHDMGRLTIETLSASSGSPFRFTIQSGSMTSGMPGSGTLFQQSIGQTVTPTTLVDWNHYAFVFQNSGSSFKTSFYLNGYHNHTVINTDLAIGELPSKDMVARIGNSITRPFKPDGTTTHIPVAAVQPMTGALDEFRYWKVARNPEEIGKNWFTQVRGGTNTDISNTTLGVYYKFNEGVANIGYLDNNVLDYSGRLTNGTWTGTASRTLSSAIVEASAAASEYKDPIIYSQHPDVVTLRNGLFASGSYHDANNTSNLKTLMPSWIIEEHEQLGNKNPELISHIVGAYFDKIYCQIESLTEFKKLQFTSASAVPLPFAEHLPQSLGMYMPQLFVDSDVISRFLNKTNDFQFENDLTETKNLIYLNLYNNLTNIYKTKGTEKSIKNVFRCFNLDDSIVKFKTYVDNELYTLDGRGPRLTQVLTNKKALFFNTSSHVGAVCYQFKDVDDTTGTRGFISGSGVGGYEKKYGFTAEADFTLPAFDIDYDSVHRDFNVSSIFGMYTASSAPESSDTLTWPAYDGGNFQVYVVREEKHSKNVFFMLSSSYVPQVVPTNMPTGSGTYIPGTTQGPFPVLTSSVYFGAYDNTDWNISVRLKPSKFPFAHTVSGSDVYDTYDLIFQGLNTKLGAIENSFVLSASISKQTAEDFLSGSKRMYVGANRKDFTGDLRFKTDVRMFNTRYWSKYLDDDSIKQHIYDLDNAGISGSFKNISPLDPNNDGYDILNRNMLVLDWNFSDVTASDGSGNFLTQDMSSGSAQIRRSYGWAGRLSGYKHPGKGSNFKPNSKSVSKDFNINTFKFIDPESAISSDAINILSSDDKAYGFPEIIPNFHYTLEKSLQDAISDEMLNFFAGVIDFNNIIGEPVNRYRSRYKKMEKLREAFFRRVTKTTQVEDYLRYYQWFDDSLSDIISQLIPASGKFSDDVFNVIESHVLERNKYKSQFPTIEFKLDDPITPILGINERLYNWKFNHAPLSMSTDTVPELGIEPGVGGPLTGSELQKVNSRWWRDRAERFQSHISTGDSNIDLQRDAIRKTIENDNNQKLNTLVTLTNGVHSGSAYVLRKLAKPYKFYAYRTASPVIPIRGGVNFEQHKKIDLTYNSLRPAGPINEDGGVYVPENVLLGDLFDSSTGKEIDTVKLRDSSDPEYRPHFSAKPNAKVYRRAKIQHGRNWEEGIGYQSVKSDISFPFNIVSASVKTGYNKLVDDRVMSGVMITNLHNDVYGPDMESPMQGPFTNYAVGGHQSRHVRLNKLADNSTHPTGSISMNKVPSDGDTITINDGSGPITFTFKNTTSDIRHIEIAGNQEQTMLNVVAKLNSFAVVTGSTMGSLGQPFKIRATTTSAGSASLVNIAKYKVGAEGIITTGEWPFEITGMHGGSGGYDQWDTRPEAWKILLGKCDDPLKIGAIGMVGPDYPLANATESKIPLPPYPSTASQKAVYYRGHVARRPVNIRNILHTTGSTILGNYEHNYQVVQAHGGMSNPRQFLEKQPNLPLISFSASSDPSYTRALTSSTSVRTLLDIYRAARDGVYNVESASALVLSGRPAHFDFGTDYSTDYLQGGLGYATRPLGGQATTNNSVIISRFSAPGGIEVMTKGYQDFRSSEFSVYNMLNNRNLTVKRPFQNQPGLSGSHPTGRLSASAVPSDGDFIRFQDGDTTRIFTFKSTVVDPTLQAEIATGGTLDQNIVATMTNLVAVINSQKDFFIRAGQRQRVDGLSSIVDFVNIKHYVKGNRPITTGGSWAGSTTDMINGTDGPEVDGIRVFDIHGNDYGLTTHAARRTARFFRDSVMRPTDQGATYDEAPAFHRVHRNNIARPKVASEQFTLNFGGTSLNNRSQLNFGDQNFNPCLLAVSNNDTHQKIERFLIPAITGAGGPGRGGTLVNNIGPGGSGFSWAGWIKFGSRNDNGTETIFSIGNKQGNSGLIRLEKRTDGGDGNVDWLFKVATENNGGDGKTNEYKWEVRNIDFSGSWNHVALVWGSPAFTGLQGNLSIERTAQAPANGDGTSTTNTLATADSGATFYVNGVSQSYVSFSPGPSNGHRYRDNQGQNNNFLGHTGLAVSGNTFFTMGINSHPNSPLSASVDEFSFWEVALDNGSIQELYNDGIPCDLTGSRVYRTSGSFLFDWIRFETVNDGIDGNFAAIQSSDTATYNATTNAIRGFQTMSFMPVSAQGSANNSTISDAENPGCPPTFLGVSQSVTFETCAQIYDNLNHYHQIPRGDRQYSWMTGAMADTDPCNLRYAGFMPMFGNQAGLYHSNTASVVGDFEPWLTMITASEYGSYFAGGIRIFGMPEGQTDATYKEFIPVDFAGLNTIIYEPVTSSTNTLGFPLGPAPGSGSADGSTYNIPTYDSGLLNSTNGYYMNTFMIERMADNNRPRVGQPAVLNAILNHRNGPYGYGTHTQFRRNPNHPVLRNEKSSSELSIMAHTTRDVLDAFGTPTGETKTTFDMTNYTLPPVSFRGRPAYLNFYSSFAFDDCGDNTIVGPGTTTLKIADNVFKIYFNSHGLNTHTEVDPRNVITPLDYVLSIVDYPEGTPGAPADVNWLVYTENVFPSNRMDFVSSSRRRTNYNNLFWRDTPADRIALGATVDTSCFIRGGLLYGEQNRVSQSAWPLDAQEDFLTRTGSVVDNGHRPGGAFGSGDRLRITSTGSYLLFNGKAGELQNNYYHYHFDPVRVDVRDGFLSYATVGSQNLPAGLYARKQMFAGFKSVAPGSGMPIPEATEGYNDKTMLEQKFPIDNPLFFKQVHTASGEALWEADVQAGIISSSRAPGVLGLLGAQEHEFKSYASKPWYDNYQDFREKIRLLAKDYAIVPEFRIHNIVHDLVRLDPAKVTTLYEIPGTGFFDTTSSFFRDYTNSERLSYFRDVNAKTSMEPREIRISVHAVKKFNPYKGFYPAQRTLDLVSQFRKSYFDNIDASFQYVSDTTTNATTIARYGNTFNDIGSYTRPVTMPLFGPGILYNSIKSGMAVDFPVLEAAVAKPNYIASYTTTGSLKTTGSLHCFSGYANSQGTTGSRNEIGNHTPAHAQNTASLIDNSSWDGDAFWDKRLPFETILDPAKEMLNLSLSDLEPNPSASIPFTASLTADGDPMYRLMARNFFGESANFFLNGGDFTTLKSQTIPEQGIMFQSGAYYGARIKMRRSMLNNRFYINEWDSGGFRRSVTGSGGTPGGSAGFSLAMSAAFGGSGGRKLLYNSGGSGIGLLFGGGEYPLPQDPAHHSSSRESFTMYSRPMAFGPPVAGRFAGGIFDLGTASVQIGFGNAGTLRASRESVSGALDCFTGHNWSFTPPYYHGEAWCDVLFYPDETRRWKVDEILKASTPIYWRVDPGPIVLRLPPATGFLGYSYIRQTALITDYRFNFRSSASVGGDTNYIGGGRNVNKIAMQLSASVNLFGIERETQNTFGPAGGLLESVNTTNGMRWVIKPKWETPHLNFNSPIRAIAATSGNLTLPSHGAGAVPRGMWHQFGIIEPDETRGIFLEIDDIPQEWLKNHYSIVNEPTLYNKGNPGIVTDPDSHGNNLHKNFRSLANVFGFTQTGKRRKLGQLAQTKTIAEAVVVIPYAYETTYDEPLITHPELVEDNSLKRSKRFFRIDQDKVRAAILANALSPEGSSLEDSGESIRKLVTKMDKYILPPEFDFVRNPTTTPIVMYIFEFKHTFDQDDLSYMWQNLAPRNYKNIEFEEQSIAHVLDTSSELLKGSDLMGVSGGDIRFMVFKVKQKAVGDYYNHVPEQVSPGNVTGFEFVGPNAVLQSELSPYTRFRNVGINVGGQDEGTPPASMAGGGGGGGQAVSPQLGTPQFNPGMSTVENEAVPGGLTPAQPPEQLYEAQYNWPYDYLSIVEGVKVDVDILFDDKSNISKSLIAEESGLDPGLTPGGLGGMFSDTLDGAVTGVVETGTLDPGFTGSPHGAMTVVRADSLGTPRATTATEVAQKIQAVFGPVGGGAGGPITGGGS